MADILANEGADKPTVDSDIDLKYPKSTHDDRRVLQKKQMATRMEPTAIQPVYPKRVDFYPTTKIHQ